MRAGACAPFTPGAPRSYFKGVQSERRDASRPQKSALRQAMSALLYGVPTEPNGGTVEQRVLAAVHAAQRAFQRFVNDELPFADYVLSKSLRGEYKANPPSPASRPPGG